MLFSLICNKFFYTLFSHRISYNVLFPLICDLAKEVFSFLAAQVFGFVY